MADIRRHGLLGCDAFVPPTAACAQAPHPPPLPPPACPGRAWQLAHCTRRGSSRPLAPQPQKRRRSNGLARPHPGCGPASAATRAHACAVASMTACRPACARSIRRWWRTPGRCCLGRVRDGAAGGRAGARAGGEGVAIYTSTVRAFPAPTSPTRVASRAPVSSIHSDALLLPPAHTEWTTCSVSGHTAAQAPCYCRCAWCMRYAVRRALCCTAALCEVSL